MSGSYKYSSFEKDEIELTRLKKQAELGLVYEKKILLEHGLKPGMDVLDLGCGPGFVSCLLGELVIDGQVLGIDQNENLLRAAVSQTPSSFNNRVQFQKGDIYHLENLGRTFDLVYSRFVFQHLEEPGRALESIASVLKPGGILIVMDVDDQWTGLEPSHPTLTEIYRLQQQYQQEQGGNRFIGRKLPELYLNAGFHQLQTQILYVSSDEIGLKNFLDLTTGYKLVFLQSKEYAISQEKVDQMYEECLGGAYKGFVGLFVVSARKT